MLVQELCTKSLKVGPKLGVWSFFKIFSFSFKILLACRVSEHNLKIWTKLLGLPLAISKTLG